MPYHEIAGRRRYEYRHYAEDRWFGWYDAGPATPETLAEIKRPFSDPDGYEVREITDLVDDNGGYIGTLIFTQALPLRANPGGRHGRMDRKDD